MHGGVLLRVPDRSMKAIKNLELRATQICKLSVVQPAAMQ